MDHFGLLLAIRLCQEFSTFFNRRSSTTAYGKSTLFWLIRKRVIMVVYETVLRKYLLKSKKSCIYKQCQIMCKIWLRSQSILGNLKACSFFKRKQESHEALCRAILLFVVSFRNDIYTLKEHFKNSDICEGFTRFWLNICLKNNNKTALTYVKESRPMLEIFQYT